MYPINAPKTIPDQGLEVIAHPMPPGDAHFPRYPRPKPIIAPMIQPMIFFQLMADPLKEE
jgi:hypothetical protein